MAYSRTLNHFTSMQELATIWASSTSYVVNQLVINSNKLYRCLIAHTSTASFATDLGAGNWVEVSASASGVKNYISNGNFENSSTTGWNLARSTLDATTKLPNQASGSWAAAAGTLSRTIVTSGQLSGVASLSLASSAATTAGDMLVTDALTLDLEAQASVQTFSFYYRVTSGAANGNFSGTSSNSIGVAIYVVDGALAGTWIQPAGVWSVNTASSVTAITAKAAGTFQVPSDATQVRLAVYFPNATTGAITVYLDDFVLGPQVVQYGAPVTDWQDYTPVITAVTTNPTLGTTTVNKARWRRVGDSMQIEYQVKQTSAGTAGSGLYFFALPSGYAIDSSKLTYFSAHDGAAGVGNVTAQTPSTTGTGTVYAYDATRLACLFVADTVGAGGVTWGSTSFAFSTALTVAFTAQVPILGWSSSVQMSNDTDTRVVDFAGYVNSATALTANVTPLPLTTVKDSHGGWSANQYTVPVSGDYFITCQLVVSVATTSSMFVYVDGVQRAFVSRASNNTVFVGSVLVTGLLAGNVLTFRCDNAVTTNVYSYALTTINRLSGPSSIAASETVAARYTTTAGNSIGTSAAAVTFATKGYDTHGAFSGSTFTAPVSGKYRATTSLYTAAVALNTSQTVSVYFYKNGSTLVSRNDTAGNGATRGYNVSASISIDLLAGETLQVFADINVATTLNTTANYNHVCIERIGN